MKRINLRLLFLASNVLALLLSLMIDGLTIIIISSVVLFLNGRDCRFVAPTLAGITNAANIGGAFSPIFGDITTMIVWISNYSTLPVNVILGSLLGFILPMFLLYFLVPKTTLTITSRTLYEGLQNVVFVSVIIIVIYIGIYSSQIVFFDDI